MRSLVWLSTLCLVTAAVATVATVEYRRRCGPASCTRTTPPVCVLEMPKVDLDADETLPEPLRGLQIMSAQMPRTDLAGEISPQMLEELERISQSQTAANLVPTAVTTCDDEFTCPPPPNKPTACDSCRCTPSTAHVPRCCALNGDWHHWLRRAVNELHCGWQAVQRFLQSCQTPVEPPRLPGLMADLSLPMTVPVEPVRHGLAEAGTQVPFLALMQVVLGVPLDEALAEALCQLFDQPVRPSIVTSSDRASQALALAAWNAELVEDGQAVIQAAFTALEPEQIAAANLVVVTRFYPVSEVMAPGQSVEQFIAEVCQQVAPRTWDRQGGLGSVVYYAPSRTLVIRQTPAVHAQLEEFFSKKRQPMPQPPAPATEPKSQAAPPRGTLELTLELTRERGIELEIVVTQPPVPTQEKASAQMSCVDGSSPPCPAPCTSAPLPSDADELADCPHHGCLGSSRPRHGTGPCSRCPCQDQRPLTSRDCCPSRSDARGAVGEEARACEVTQVQYVETRTHWWNLWTLSECPRSAVGIPARPRPAEEEGFSPWPPQVH